MNVRKSSTRPFNSAFNKIYTQQSLEAGLAPGKQIGKIAGGTPDINDIGDWLWNPFHHAEHILISKHLGRPPTQPPRVIGHIGVLLNEPLQTTVAFMLRIYH